MPDRPGISRAALLVLAGSLLSALLLVLLFRTLPFKVADFREALTGARWAGLAGILATTLFHCWITGIKWRYVTRLTSHGVELGAGYYFYSALIGLLGQVLPLQVAMLAGRSLALRIHGNVPLRRGAGAVVYDQFFDLLLPATMVVPILLAALHVVPVEAGGWLCLGAVGTTGVVLALFGEQFILTMLRPLLLLPRSWKFTGLARALHEGSPLTGRPVLFTLFAFSSVRVANLVFRAWLVGWTLHLDLSWPVVLFANCGVTFSLIFAFLPGALGVVEWGWVGMLHLYGVGTLEATHYALSSRLFAVAALVTINLVHAIVLVAYWGLRGRHRRRRNSPSMARPWDAA